MLGLALGPLLFSLFVNELPRLISASHLLFVATWRRPGDGNPRGGSPWHIPLEFLHVIRLPPSEQLHDFFGDFRTLGYGIYRLTTIEHFTLKPFSAH